MKKNYFYILFILGLTFCCYSASIAQTITLQTIIKSTREHFPVIKAAEQNIAIAQGQFVASKGAFDPTLSSNFFTTPRGGYENIYDDTKISVPIVIGGARVYAGYRNGRGDWPSYFQDFLTNTGGEVRFGLDLPLLRDFHIDPQRANLRSAALNILLQREKAALIRVDTLRQAGIAYWNWVAAAKRLTISQQLLDLATTRQKALVRRFQLGDAAHIEIVENERFILQRRALLVFAKLDFRRASIFLSLYYRNRHGRPLLPRIQQAPKRLPYISKKTTNEGAWLNQGHRIIAQNPAVRIINWQTKIRRIRLHLSENDLLPRFDSRFSVKRQYGSNGDPLLRPVAYTAGLRFVLPLPRRLAKGEYLQNRSRLDQLEIRERFTRESLNAQLKNALNELENDRKQVFLLRGEVNLALQVERAEIIRFNEGDSSLFLVNQREQTTFTARLQALNAAIAYFRSRLNLRAICAFQPYCFALLRQ